MNPEIIARHAPDARFMAVVRLHGYEVVFDGASRLDGGATTNIARAPGKLVHGALYRITALDLAALDAYEGYPEHYQRSEMVIHTGSEPSQPADALVYRRAPRERGVPSRRYLGEVLAGARARGLPAEALDALEQQAVA